MKLTQDSSSSAGRFCSTPTVSLPPVTDTELLVVNSARVSLSKSHSHLLETDRTLIRFLYRNNHWTPFGHPQLTITYPKDAVNLSTLLLKASPGCERTLLTDETVIERGSLWYWLKNRHLYGEYVESIINAKLLKHAPITADAACIPQSPELKPQEFEISDSWVAEDIKNRLHMAWITVLIEAPVPIRTQLFKHKVGFVENEVSRRYVDSPPCFFLPAEWRERAPGVKQGSLSTPVKYPRIANLVAKTVYLVSNWGYRTLLSLGGCPEQARFLLAQGMMTQWYWTGSLNAVFRAIHLRDQQHAQVETWKIMQSIKHVAEQRWPKTCQKAFSPLSGSTDPT